MYITGAPRNWVDFRPWQRTIITCVDPHLPRPLGSHSLVACGGCRGNAWCGAWCKTSWSMRQATRRCTPIHHAAVQYQVRLQWWTHCRPHTCHAGARRSGPRTTKWSPSWQMLAHRDSCTLSARHTGIEGHPKRLSDCKLCRHENIAVPPP